jgi:hypothetical protein
VLEDIGNTDQKINEKKEGKKYPGGMPEKILLYSKGKQQGQTEAYGGKDMEYNGQVHLRFLPLDCDNITQQYYRAGRSHTFFTPESPSVFKKCMQ